MASTSGNILLKELAGQIGKQLVFKQYGNKTVVSVYPDMSRRKLSKKQKKVNEIMKAANLKARLTIADEKKRNEALLRLNVVRNKLYTSLVREYWQTAKNELKAS